MGSFGSRGGLKYVVPVKQTQADCTSEVKTSPDDKRTSSDKAAPRTSEPFIDLRKKEGF